MRYECASRAMRRDHDKMHYRRFRHRRHGIGIIAGFNLGLPQAFPI